MSQNNYSNQAPAQAEALHFGHLGVIALVAVLLLGATWLEQPQLFQFKKANTDLSDANVPHYYPYVAPPEDQPLPEVLGASTDEGPQIINDDGSVQPVDMGEVLAASTQGVQLSPDSIKVNTESDSAGNIQKYFDQSQSIESGFAGDAAFAAAINSGDQDQINAQATKLIAVRDALQKILVPLSLVKLQQLQIIQYNSAIALMQNFTQGNQQPDQVNSDFEQFMKSEQDLDTENAAVSQEYPTEFPLAALYVSSDGSLLPQATDTPSDFTLSSDSSGSSDQSGTDQSDNLDSSNAGQ